MPKYHNLYKFQFNCERWLSSNSVSKMLASQRGIYINLMAHAWLEKDCGLPLDELILRKLGEPDSDEQWDRDWPIVKREFYIQNGKLYNKHLKELFDESMSRYETAIENASKPPKPGKNPRGRPPQKNLNKNLQENLTVFKKGRKKNLEVNLEQNLQENLSQISDLITHNAQPPLGGEAGLQPIFDINTRGFKDRIKRIISNQVKKRVREKLFRWANTLDPVRVNEILTKIEDCADPKIREAKDYGPLQNPGGYLYTSLSKLAEESKND